MRCSAIPSRNFGESRRRGFCEKLFHSALLENGYNTILIFLLWSYKNKYTVAKLHRCGILFLFTGDIMKITVLVDNNESKGWHSEHGLALLLEHLDGYLLFDTGAGKAMPFNLIKAGFRP